MRRRRQPRGHLAHQPKARVRRQRCGEESGCDEHQQLLWQREAWADRLVDALGAVEQQHTAEAEKDRVRVHIAPVLERVAERRDQRTARDGEAEEMLKLRGADENGRGGGEDGEGGNGGGITGGVAGEGGNNGVGNGGG